MNVGVDIVVDVFGDLAVIVSVPGFGNGYDYGDGDGNGDVHDQARDAILMAA